MENFDFGKWLEDKGFVYCFSAYYKTIKSTLYALSLYDSDVFDISWMCGNDKGNALNFIPIPKSAAEAEAIFDRYQIPLKQ